MTSHEIRQSFLDFFKEKEHTVVPSASLMPQSPGLLFTNAGMNQFVPYFLGEDKAPYNPPRAADTQKCIRAGGKHNDLEDVGYDTYHHTMFEMLGNWSFGDYFKKEAIAWAWELVIERWGFPAERLYATIYQPADGDPGERDEEAYAFWEPLFTKAGLDPKVHIVDGDKKDNFWMMGDTGPCGPCSELHVDLTPKGDTKGSLVNQDDPRCIEIWNLVFIQYNAEQDGSFRPLPSTHVDTGMGFERVVSILQGTDGLTNFDQQVSNYATDIFAPFFRKLEAMSGKKYANAMPGDDADAKQIENDIAFRVIADHIRTLSFSIADGIEPGNKERNYVLRRILRRAVRYGRTVGLGEDGQPFLSKLVPTLVAEFSEVFPEVKARQAHIEKILDREELSFNRTLDRGIKLFEQAAEKLGDAKEFPADVAVKLYDTFGFPTDLTALMAREKGFELQEDAVDAEIEKIRKISQDNQQTVVVTAKDFSTSIESEFVGFEENSADAKVHLVFSQEDSHFAIVDKCPLYAEKGGQVSDTGVLTAGGDEIQVLNTTQIERALVVQLEEIPTAYTAGETLDVSLQIDAARRRRIEAHHTVTHIMHWALHQVVSPDLSQKGSFVGPDRLRFDFNSDALTDQQIADVERLVNERILENDVVSWQELPYEEVKKMPQIMQFFGDKYGEFVRVVQIGGTANQLDGYSMELCGGTHVRSTGQLGVFKIRSEGAIAAGIRRIEAVCGIDAYDFLNAQQSELESEKADLEAKLLEAKKTLEKERSAMRLKQADSMIMDLINNAENGAITAKVDGDAALLQEFLTGLKKRNHEGVAVFGAPDGDKVHIGIYVHKSLTKTHQAGKLMQALAPIVGGRGGGKPEMARGAGDDPSKLDEMLTEAQKLIS